MIWSLGVESLRRLTVKLRGRAQAPDWSRGCTLSPRTRGDTTDSHGPLQRLLGGERTNELTSNELTDRAYDTCAAQDHSSLECC